MTLLRIFVPAATLGLGFLLVGGAREQHATPPRKPLPQLSFVVEGKNSRDIQIDPEERRVAGMSDYLMRSYGPDSAPDFTLYVGYYDRQVQGKAIHSPRNCLPGAGWEIMQSSRIALPGGAAGQSANRVLLANRGIYALVYYWYQGRGRVESSEYRVKWNLLQDAAVYGRTEEALVRLVFPLYRRANRAGLDSATLNEAEAWATTLLPSVGQAVALTMPELVR